MKNYKYLICLCTLLQSCSFKVEKINIGKDQCQFCKMTIADARFGGAILTKKGKTLKFDDMFCTQSFITNELIHNKDIKQIFIQNYKGTNELLDLNLAYIIEGPYINGPMGGKYLGFKSKEEYQPLANELNGKKINENYFK